MEIFEGFQKGIVDIGNVASNSLGTVANTFQMVGENIKKVVIQKDPSSIVQEQLQYYNEKNIDKFSDMFSDDIIVSNYQGSASANIAGKEAFKETYERLFNDFPENRADLVHRIVIKNRVLDHEKVYRSGGETPTFECVAIYTIVNERITRIDFIK